jgi:nucleotide-binding universal stress UspA family protein
MDEGIDRTHPTIKKTSMKALIAMILEPEGSRGFIEYAVNLARDLNTNVHLLYVENPDNIPLGTPDMTGAATVQLQRILEERVKHAKATLGRYAEDLMDQISGKIIMDISAETDTERSVLERMIRENEDQMVIMESSGVDSFWAGRSPTRDIVSNVGCPIWVVPRDAEYETFRQIIYATDYNEEDIPTLLRLIGLTHSFSPHITALHITDSVDFDLKVKKAGFQEIIRAKTDYRKINVETLMEKDRDDVARIINDYAARTGADLIVVLKENRNFLERIFRSSSTDKIIKHARIPVLVYHEHK